MSLLVQVLEQEMRGHLGLSFMEVDFNLLEKSNLLNLIVFDE